MTVTNGKLYIKGIQNNTLTIEIKNMTQQLALIIKPKFNPETKYPVRTYILLTIGTIIVTTLLLIIKFLRKRR